MNALLSQNDFDRYARLVSTSIPDLSGLALCDSKGRIIYHQSFGEVEILPPIQQLGNRRPDWVSTLRSRQLQSVPGDGTYLSIAGMRDSQGQPVAALVALLPAAVQQADVIASLETVAECVEHDLALASELDQMTAELTERYEELNLVYHTEDQVNVFRQGREALHDLTQNCLDYLDVGLAVLILKDKGVTISCSQPDGSIANVPRVKLALAEKVYAWVQENNETLVINDMSEPLAVRLTPGIPYRVLGCPILDKAGLVAGMLATVNNYAREEFVNSDKNLMQVMARKAAKIVIANYDDLTGLMNRSGYEYYLGTAFMQVQSTDVEKSLLHINVDQLHIINDTVSHAAGDAVIKSVAAIVADYKRDCDTLSRLGGDEFGLILHNCSLADAADSAERIRRRIEDTPIEYQGNSFNVTASIGIALLSGMSESVAQAVSTAELACSMAKEQGRNRVETYRSDNVDLIRREEQMHLVAHIQQALAENRFTLYSQPIRPLAPDNRVHHTEILLRLLDENGKVLNPGTFIPAAERYHLMPSIDRWVIKRTFAELSSFDEEPMRNSVFAINLSGQSICEKDFLDFIHAEFDRSGIPPESICFEITETAAVANLSKAVRFMKSLRDIGCSFSLDDFGSGISSFGYLKNLPVNYLKIDGAIVKDIVVDEVSAAMVTAINEVGHTMNLRTIAEFVENEAIESCLAKIGVDYVQGFGVGKPGPFSRYLRELMSASSQVAS